MSIKLLLRFYFSAGRLNSLLDDMIMQMAVTAGADGFCGCERQAKRIEAVIAKKSRMGELWERLDGIMQKLTDGDLQTLKAYAAQRRRIKEAEKKEFHRAIVKFTRRARRLLDGGEEQFNALSAYACLLSPAPD